MYYTRLCVYYVIWIGAWCMMLWIKIEMKDFYWGACTLMDCFINFTYIHTRTNKIFFSNYLQ